MVTHSTIEIDRANVTVGNVTRPVWDVVSIISDGTGIRVCFRDGSSMSGGVPADLFTLRDECPWAMVSI